MTAKSGEIKRVPSSREDAKPLRRVEGEVKGEDAD